VTFSAAADEALALLAAAYPDLRQLVTAVLEQDPRPAWRQRDPDDKQYGMNLYDLNIKWRVYPDRLEVVRIEPAGQGD